MGEDYYDFCEHKAKDFSFVEDGKECAVCGYNLFAITQNHHITPLAAFAVGNYCGPPETVYLCPNCHALAHKIFGKRNASQYRGPRSVTPFVNMMKRIISLEPWRVGEWK